MPVSLQLTAGESSTSSDFCSGPQRTVHKLTHDLTYTHRRINMCTSAAAAAAAASNGPSHSPDTHL